MTYPRLPPFRFAALEFVPLIPRLVCPMDTSPRYTDPSVSSPAIDSRCPWWRSLGSVAIAIAVVIPSLGVAPVSWAGEPQKSNSSTPGGTPLDFAPLDFAPLDLAPLDLASLDLAPVPLELSQATPLPEPLPSPLPGQLPNQPNPGILWPVDPNLPLGTFPPSAGATITPTYLLGAGDVVFISIFSVPEYTEDYTIRPDGSLMLPEELGGAVSVGGMTLEQATQAISQHLAPILRRPLVTLSLTQTRPLKVAIAGEVKRPGVYTFEELVTLTEALTQAGGVTPMADVRQVQIQRRSPQGQVPLPLQANLWDLITQGALAQDLSLQDGDTIVIPTVTTLNPQESQRVTEANFASQRDETIQVAVLGQVQRPGSHTLSGETQTVSAAIAAAGGITQQANVRAVEVRRPTSQGEPQVITLDFWKLLQEGDLSQDLPLQSGDAVMIRQATLTGEAYGVVASSTLSPSTIPVNLVGEVKQPGTLSISPNTPLSQAILAAGGFSDSASRGSVQLVRVNPDGTVSQRTLTIDLAKGLDPSTNPPLQPNDTIIVARSGVGNFQNMLRGFLSPVTGLFSIFRLLGL